MTTSAKRRTNLRPRGPGRDEREDQDEGPDEVELLFDAEGPEVLERPADAGGGVVVEEEQGAEEVNAGEREAAESGEDGKDGDIEVEGRKDAEGAPEIEASERDAAGAVVFVKEETGNEVAGDDEEDIDAGGAVEEGVPEKRGVVLEVVALEGVEGHDEKDRDGAKSIERGDARHGSGASGNGYVRSHGRVD